MAIRQQIVFATAMKIREALFDLSREESHPEEEEFSEEEVLTCLQLAAEHIAMDCFELEVFHIEDDLYDIFRDYRVAHEPVPTLRVQPAG